MVETPLTREYFDEQFDVLTKAVKSGFDSVDERFNAVDERLKTIETDLTDIKRRLSAVEDEVRVLSANMVTKQYLDEKIEYLIDMQRKDALFKRRLLLALEEANVLTPDVRSQLEHLIPTLSAD